MATNTKKGFSLIEMVVYIAILVFMLGIIIQVVFSLTRANRTIKAARTVELSAVTSLERIGREVRQADSVDIASSTLSSHPGVLSLDGTDSAGTAYALEFYLSGSQIRMRKDGVDAGALTQASSTVTSLLFTRFSATSTEGVRVEMSVESGTTTAYRSETFYSTFIIR